MTCYRRKSTGWLGKLFSSKKYVKTAFSSLDIWEFVISYIHQPLFPGDVNILIAWLTLKSINMSTFSLTGNLTPIYAAYLFLSILNCNIHWGLSFTLTGQRNEQNECDECDVLFSVISIFPWLFKIVYIPCLFHIQWYHDHNIVQSPTPKLHFNIIVSIYNFYVINILFNSRKCVLSYLLFIIYSYTFWT